MPSKQPPRKDKNRVPRAKRVLAPAKKDAERVAKVIARAGLGSRREIEDWIAAGRVAVNGAVLESPAVTVTAQDRIEVDGQPLPEKERTRLFIYHKPKGVVTTNRDPEGRTTLFEILPRGLPRLVSVGRLDLNSEGLLLLTNDGGLARTLELPETGWLRRYRVRAKGEIDQAKLDTLLKGVTVEGIEYGPIEAVLDRVQGANAWITVALREGKNREVRNVLAALGMIVNRLIRISYGPFQLGEIPEGGIEEVRTRILRDQIGDDIAAASGADFDAPVIERTIEETPRRPPRARDEEEASPGPTRGPRRPEREPEARGRARHPQGMEEETASFRLRSRRAPAEREVESRGTVADRKGREIKVERVVAPREEERPARRPGPSRGRPAERSERNEERPRRSGASGAKRSAAPKGPDAGFSERPRGRRPVEGRTFERDEAPRGRGPRPEGGSREDFRRGDGRPSARPRRREDEAREDFRPRHREEGPGGRSAPPRRRREDDAPREDFRPWREERPEGKREERRGRSGPPGRGAGPKDRSGAAPRARRREDVGFIERDGERPPRGKGGPKGAPRGGAPRGAAGPKRGGPKGAGPKGGGPKRSGPPRGGKPSGPRGQR